MKRANIHTSVAIILSAAFLFTGCRTDTADTTQKLQIESIDDADEAVAPAETGKENAAAEEKQDADTVSEAAAARETQDTDAAREIAAQKESQNNDPKNLDTGKQQPSADQASVYEDVLAQYRDMVRHDFYIEFLDSDDYESHFGEDIGEEIRCNHRQNIFYALYDIDGNGTEELIIAGEEGHVGVSNPAFAPWYYDIYGYDGSRVVSLFPDIELGGRTNFSLHGDGVIEVVHSLTLGEIGIDIYKIGNDGVTPELVDRFYTAADLTGEKAVYTYFQNGQTGSEISEEAYRSALQSYETPLAEELIWEEIY